MSRARAISLHRRYTPNTPPEPSGGITPQPAPPSAESQQVAQLAYDVLAAEELLGEVAVNPWSGGYYVTLTAQGKERTVYLFSLKDERSNRDVLRQAAKDLKSVVLG